MNLRDFILRNHGTVRRRGQILVGDAELLVRYRAVADADQDLVRQCGRGGRQAEHEKQGQLQREPPRTTLRSIRRTGRQTRTGFLCHRMHKMIHTGSIHVFSHTFI